jgi:ankyrin repeat protein
LVFKQPILEYNLYDKGEVMLNLLNHGAKVSAKNSDGELFLHTCISHLDDRFANVIEMITEIEGIDMNQENIDGNSPLNVARLCNKPNIIKVLLKKGATIPQMEEKVPYLHHILKTYCPNDINYELLQIILKRGDVDVYEVSSNGKSIFELSRENINLNSTRFKELFKEKKHPWND